MPPCRTVCTITCLSCLAFLLLYVTLVVSGRNALQSTAICLSLPLPLLTKKCFDWTFDQQMTVFMHSSSFDGAFAIRISLGCVISEEDSSATCTYDLFRGSLRTLLIGALLALFICALFAERICSLVTGALLVTFVCLKRNSDMNNVL